MKLISVAIVAFALSLAGPVAAQEKPGAKKPSADEQHRARIRKSCEDRVSNMKGETRRAAINDCLVAQGVPPVPAKGEAASKPAPKKAEGKPAAPAKAADKPAAKKPLKADEQHRARVRKSCEDRVSNMKGETRRAAVNECLAAQGVPPAK